MATILIDKLLQTVVNQGASDLHIAVGQPPVLRLHGHLRKLETKVLDAGRHRGADEEITPERCQQELQEEGGADFGFAFGDQARFRVSIFKQRGNVAMVLRQIPNKFLTIEQLGLPRPCTELVMRPRGLFLVTGPTGSGKSTSAGQHDQLHERERRPSHHHDRRPDRVLSPAQEDRRSTSARSASTCRASPRPSAAPCGRIPT